MKNKISKAIFIILGLVGLSVSIYYSFKISNPYYIINIIGAYLISIWIIILGLNYNKIFTSSDLNSVEGEKKNGI